MTTQTRVTMPFTAQSTAAEVLAGLDLAGRRAIVTGGASGIGIETARALAGAGAEVTLAVRNLDAGEQTARDIVASTGSAAPSWKTPEQSAATSVLVAASPLPDGIGGRYFEDCNEAGLNVPGTRQGVAVYALDPDAAQRLWQVSVQTLAA